MQGVVINPVVAIDADLSLDNREAVRERLERAVVNAIEGDGRFREAKKGIEESGFVDDYEKHGVTFHLVVDEDGTTLNTAASSQKFLDPALLEEDYMTADEFEHHTTKLRELAADVAETIDLDDYR